MPTDLAGKIAIVTGASRGIGRGIAKAFCSSGATVVAIARDMEKLKSLTGDCVGLSGKVVPQGADVTDSARLEEIVEGTVKEFGTIDILVNNAGITKDGLLLRMKEEDWDDVISTNLKSMFLLSKLVCRHMMSQRRGKIINITSVVGIMGNAGQANYAASKAGIIGFTKSVAKEFGSRNIACNAIAPGLIETDMTEAMTGDVRDKIRKEILLRRFGTVEDISRAALFLAGPESDYITGQTLVVDGGMTL